MKKTFLYAFAAAVLGVGIMLFPLWAFFRSYNEEGPIGFKDGLPYVKSTADSPNWENFTQSRGGIPTFGGDNDIIIPRPKPTDSSLQMLIIGFIVAMAAYLIVRRKSPRQMPTYRFPPI